MAESNLVLERNKLINTLDTMADGVYIENQLHEVEYANPSLQQDFGNSHGKTCNEYFLQNQGPCCPWCKIDDNEQKTIRMEWHASLNDKTYDLIITPLNNPDGSYAMMGIFRDISEHKKAREEIDKRIKELEEFYEMAVGRELKMKALKEEADNLREEVKDLRSRMEM